jgi:hypothetical protein
MRLSPAELLALITDAKGIITVLPEGEMEA